MATEEERKKARRDRKKMQHRLDQIKLEDQQRRMETPEETAQRLIRDMHPQKWDNDKQKFIVA